MLAALAEHWTQTTIGVRGGLVMACQTEPVGVTLSTP
jgi:hypothetical protein